MATNHRNGIDLEDPYRDPVPVPVRVRRTRRTFGIPTGYRTSTIPAAVPVDLADPYRDPAPSTSTSTSTSTEPVDLADPYRDPAPSTSTSTSTEPGHRVRAYVTAAILAASIITTGQPAAAIHDGFRSTVATWHESVTFCDGAATRTGALRIVERAGYGFCHAIGIEARGQ